MTRPRERASDDFHSASLRSGDERARVMDEKRIVHPRNPSFHERAWIRMTTM